MPSIAKANESTESIFVDKSSLSRSSPKQITEEVEKEQEMSPNKDASSIKEGPERHAVPRKDGGLKAWLQVLGAWCLAFTTW